MIPEPNCFARHCKHFIGVRNEDEGDQVEVNERPCCKAFPMGIPEEIAYGTNLHLTPYPDDNGLQYEPEPDHFIEV
jgi:hypothetical protein